MEIEKDIAKLIRKELKKEYPNCKFSITIQRYSGGQSLNIDLMECNFEVFKKDKDGRFFKNYTDESKEILSNVKNLVNQYNYDDSDGMIDYFNTNFYLHLNIGKWNKPFRKIQG